MWRGSGTWRAACSVLAAVFLLGAPEADAQNAKANVKAGVTVNTSGGFARLVFNFDEDVESSVRLANNVLVISFKRPVDVGVDRISNNNDYFSVARRDPDGSGVRIALKRKVRVNSMVAGERLFVDLLPEGWDGPLPSLPQEVIEDLSKRMKEAEKRAKQQESLDRARPVATGNVRVSRQPTFTRYIFELPELMAVNAERGKDKLILTFGTPLKFDLTDARLMQPPLVESIEASMADAATTVAFSFVGRIDIRSFREDNNYVVDVLNPDSSTKVEEGAAPTGYPAVLGGPTMNPPERSVPPSSARSGLMPVPVAPGSAAREPPEKPRASGAAPVEKGVAAAAGKETKNSSLPPAESAAKTSSPEAADGKPSLAASAPPQTPGANVKAADANAQTTEKTEQAGQAVQSSTVAATARRQGETIQLAFPFQEQVAAAVFVRADSLWLVFDSTKPINVDSVKNEAIRRVSVEKQDDFQVVRIKLDRPRLVSAGNDDFAWTIDLADIVTRSTQPLSVLRSIVTDKRASVQIPLDDPRKLHRLSDPEIGDELTVVTAFGPSRGLPKTQDFVDFRTLASTHGLAIQSFADDLTIELAADRVWIARPNGLTLTSSSLAGRRNGSLRPALFDSQQWGFDREAEFPKRYTSLLNALAQAGEQKRNGARMDLARFYFARDMYPEAKAVLDLALQEEHPTPEDTTGLVMRGITKIFMGRPEDGLKDLNSPMVGNQNDALLWRAVASAREGKWPEAREGLRASETAIAALPLELQRRVLMEGVRASVEVRDFSVAETQLKELEALGPTSELADLPILIGRVHEGLGENIDALTAYRDAANSQNRALAAQGRMREIALRYRLGDLNRADVVAALETLTAIWRGDDTEVEALQLLAKLYIEDGRYRDAFNLMRIAVTAHPESEMTRRIQDDAAAAFDKLFLGGKADTLSPIEALALFYDFRELTPIGRRGDEMIRRLADRLVAVDLLDQAAELLQHQIDHRLQGAARAQVATRLAVIHLLNRKPERALQVLKATRTADLSSELKNQRLMLEARALSDVGRHGLAFDVIQNLNGPEAGRLRSDILWAAKRYRESAEQIEVLYGDRWRDWTPLTDVERRDILRAGISYALAEDIIGIERFREKFTPIMSQGTDRKAFDLVTSPYSTTKPEFQEIVRSIAAVDTLGQFLRDMRARFPDNPPSSPANENDPQTRLQRPDRLATGAIARAVAREDRNARVGKEMR